MKYLSAVLLSLVFLCACTPDSHTAIRGEESTGLSAAISSGPVLSEQGIEL